MMVLRRWQRCARLCFCRVCHRRSIRPGPGSGWSLAFHDLLPGDHRHRLVLRTRPLGPLPGAKHPLGCLLLHPAARLVADPGAPNLLGLGLFVLVNILILSLIESLRASRLETEKRSRQLAQVQEEQFQRFMDQIPVATWIKEHGGRFQFASRSFGKLLGLDPARIVGRTTTELFPGDVAEIHLAGDQLARDSADPVELHERLVLPDGSVTEQIVLKFPIPGPGASLLSAVSPSTSPGFAKWNGRSARARTGFTRSWTKTRQPPG